MFYHIAFYKEKYELNSYFTGRYGCRRDFFSKMGNFFKKNKNNKYF